MPKFRMTKVRYDKYKKIFILTENTVIGYFLIFGVQEQSVALLGYKLLSSYVLNMSDVFFS